MGEEFGKIVPFFPELRKIDFFEEAKVSMKEVALDFCHGHALGIDQETGKNRIFGFGNAQWG